VTEEHVTVWRRASAVLERATPRSLVLLHRDVGDPVILNASGAAIWDALEHPRPEPALVEEVAAAFGVDADVVCDGVRATLQQLAALNLLER
jgi:hypothetical protein